MRRQITSAPHPARLARRTLLALDLCVLAPSLGRAQGSAGRDVRVAAAHDTGLRVLVGLAQRRLWVLSAAGDTLLAAPVAVGSGRTLRTSSAAWTFATPRGRRIVRSKEVNPIWVRPEWSYVEAARRHALRVRTSTRRVPRPSTTARGL
jgi:hypothetical protein